MDVKIKGGTVKVRLHASEALDLALVCRLAYGSMRTPAKNQQVRVMAEALRMAGALAQNNRTRTT